MNVISESLQTIPLPEFIKEMQIHINMSTE